MSTGLGDMLYSSNIVLELKPKRSRILSSGVNLINGSYPENSIIVPSVEKLGSIVNE